MVLFVCDLCCWLEPALLSGHHMVAHTWSAHRLMSSIKQHLAVGSRHGLFTTPVEHGIQMVGPIIITSQPSSDREKGPSVLFLFYLFFLFRDFFF